MPPSTSWEAGPSVEKPSPNESDLSRQGLGLGMVLLAAVFVSLIPNTAKISYQEGANPLAVITLRALLGMIGLGTYMALRCQGFRIGTTRASALSIIEPVLTILLAILLVNEWLTAIQWPGVALVVASLLVIELPKDATQLLRRLKAVIPKVAESTRHDGGKIGI